MKRVEETSRLEMAVDYMSVSFHFVFFAINVQLTGEEEICEAWALG